MPKTILIFKHEFLHNTRRAGYVFLTLTVPLLALLAIGIALLITSFSDSPEANILQIGYVDACGLVEEYMDEDYVSFLPYASKELANQGLSKGEISTYILIPGDYLTTGSIERFTLEQETASSPAMIYFIQRLLSGNLLREKVTPEVLNLVISPLQMEVSRVTSQGEQALEQMRFANVLIPGVFALLLSLALMFGSITLVNGLGEEKESRLIEVLFSSVSIRQLLLGKVMALGLAGLLQVLIWLISAPLLLLMASSLFGGLFEVIEIPENFIGLGLLYFILGYLLFAVLSIGVGAITPTAREGGQLSMFYVMLGFVPLWFATLLFAFPNGIFSVVLTLFPVTAPVQNMLRLGVTDIPLWQILLSLSLLVLSIAFGLYVSIRVFRVYMLMHGKRPGLKTILKHLRTA